MENVSTYLDLLDTLSPLVQKYRYNGESKDIPMITRIRKAINNYSTTKNQDKIQQSLLRFIWELQTVNVIMSQGKDGNVQKIEEQLLQWEVLLH